MSKLKFKKGEFITQILIPESFAIFEGEEYGEPGSDNTVYSLICYHNPNHVTKTGNGCLIREHIFEYDLEGEKTCEYGIYASEMDCWRRCTQNEIDDALKTLAKKGLAWLETTNKFRRLEPNEQIRFETPQTSAHRTSPMYENTPGLVNPNYSRGSVSISRKAITRVVNDAWEQKEPITTMNAERKHLVIEQCDKLKFAFNTYNYNNVVVYPNNGAQVPRRAAYPYLGYGMCAYNALMNEAEYWGYCD